MTQVCRGRTLIGTPNDWNAVPAAVRSGPPTAVPLLHGPHFFGDLRDRLPDISPKALTERLGTLRERGPVKRRRLPGFPVGTRYTLTATGQALRPLLVELYRTGPVLAEARHAP
ncbi:winged helix-turn-helix transcriptional regulator [Streptomyces sp. NPDC014806]|uniref:winged helix-turn-helix transcriptional regulator n=1 Tax=Streptomyces sp. NPDC014806 TaxID=3364920 RepID=UPI0036FF4D0F